MLVGRACDERLRFHVVVGDEVRKTARGVGRELAPFEGDNFEFVGRGATAGLSRRAHPGGVTADDDEPLRHDFRSEGRSGPGSGGARYVRR
jgi:hypothetical protein